MSMILDSPNGQIKYLAKGVSLYGSDNLHPCSIVTLAFPEIPAALVAVQLMVPKSCAVSDVNTSTAIFSLLISVLVSSSIQVYSVTCGLVLVTLQNNVVEPCMLTFIRVATTSTTGITA